MRNGKYIPVILAGMNNKAPMAYRPRPIITPALNEYFCMKMAVTLLECFEFGHVGFIAIGSLFHQSDETVGHSAERRNHHNHRTFRPADNISDMKDALTRANGRSSEFEYFHFDNV